MGSKGSKHKNKNVEDQDLPKTSILDLPPEVIVKIFRCLSVDDVHVTCKQVCRLFESIVSLQFEPIDFVRLDLCNQQGQVLDR